MLPPSRITVPPVTRNRPPRIHQAQQPADHPKKRQRPTQSLSSVTRSRSRAFLAKTIGKQPTREDSVARPGTRARPKSQSPALWPLASRPSISADAVHRRSNAIKTLGIRSKETSFVEVSSRRSTGQIVPASNRWLKTFIRANPLNSRRMSSRIPNGTTEEHSGPSLDEFISENCRRS
jgi:hypothetical protein